MAKRCLYSSGQDSLLRLKYAAVSVLLASHAPGKRLIDIVISAVGFMEGYDANGLSLSPRFDDFSGHAMSSSLLLAPYRTPLKTGNTPTLGTFQKKYPNISPYSEGRLPQLKVCTTPMETISKSTECGCITPFSEFNRVKIFKPGTGEQDQKQKEISISVTPANIGRRDVNQDEMVGIIDTVYLSSKGHFAVEEMVYSVMKCKLSSHVLWQVFENVLAAGVTIPKSIIHEVLSRMSTEDEDLARDIAFLLNSELQLPYYRFSVNRKKIRTDNLRCWPSRYLKKHVQSSYLECQPKGKEKKLSSSSYSRLQSVRSRGKNAP